MQISNCANPSWVRNKFTGIDVCVPCGKCEPCIIAKGAQWKQRLIEESKLWKFVFFFTLTYKDEYLPRMEVLSVEDDMLDSDTSKCFLYVLLDEIDTNIKSNKHFFSYDTNLISNSYSFRYSKNDYSFNDACVDKYGYIPVLSKTDARKFMLNFRHRFRELYGHEEFQWFLIGEYGSTRFRPHYHGLIFANDSRCAQEKVFPDSIANCIDFSWSNMVFDNGTQRDVSIGLVDVQISDCSKGNFSYVSQYLNCFTNLPQILRSKECAPFRLCGKRKAIGFVEPSKSALCSEFYCGSGTRIVYDSEKREYALEILPRAYRSRLFVESRGFDQINVRHLGAWIIIVSRLLKFSEFERFVSETQVRQLEDISIDILYNPLSSIEPRERLKSLYYSLKKASKLCLEFGCPPYLYGYYLQRFKSKIELFRLRQFYELQEMLSNDVLFDVRFLNCLYKLNDSLFDRPLCGVSSSELKYYNNIDNCNYHKSYLLKAKKILLDTTKSKKRNSFFADKNMQTLTNLYFGLE